MRVILNVATMDSVLQADNYPAGDYSLNVINQKRFDPPARERFAIAPEWISSVSIGLAKSRNAGLSVVGTDAVVLIGDNDVRYLPAFDQQVRSAYERHPDADVILFKVSTPDGTPFKKYPSKAQRYGLRDIMRACSIEISFRAESIAAAGIRFDEQFGLGARFETGEDIIFLADCLRAGLKVVFVPTVICVHASESSGSAHTERLLYAKGAMFRRIFGPFGLVASVAYCLKRARSDSALGLVAAIRACSAGAACR